MLNHISTYLAVVEAGSFVQAAVNLKTTQATVSRHLKDLEDELGVMLIHRTSRSFKITEIGQQFYDTVMQQQVELGNLVERFKQNKTQITGRVRLSMPLGIPYHVVNPYIGKFMRQNPGITLEICYQFREVDLLKEKFDLAIIDYLPDQQTYIIRKLSEFIPQMYCTPEYAVRYGLPQTIEELVTQNHLYTSHMWNDLAIKYSINSLHPTHGINKHQEKSRFFTNNALHNKTIVLGGEVIVYGWDELFRDDLDSGRVIKALPEYSFEKINVYLIRNRNNRNAAIEAVIAFLEDCFKAKI